MRFDFSAHRDAGRMGTHEVAGEPPHDREVLGTVVFSSSAAIFVDEGVEHPMQLVLDTPMIACDLQQTFGGEVLGEQVIAHGELVGAPTPRSPARSDASQGSHAGKAVCGADGSVANDGGTAGFVPIVVRWLDASKACEEPVPLRLRAQAHISRIDRSRAHHTRRFEPRQACVCRTRSCQNVGHLPGGEAIARGLMARPKPAARRALGLAPVSI